MTRTGHFGERTSGYVRKASKADGDDVTFSRFVKVKPTERRPEQPLLLKTGRRPAPVMLRHNPSIHMARSLFFRKSVKNPNVLPNVLVSGHNNIKIGRDVRKGRKFRGYWIYTLSLEERATCPSTCQQWTTCYGNHMPYAKRVDHSNEVDLQLAIRRNLEKLCVPHKGRGGKPYRKGVLIRLHALGDFFSESYVRFWERMLDIYPNLAIYGYTARNPETENIGMAIAAAKEEWGDRFAIRWSDGDQDTDCTVSLKHADEKPDNAFICPEQTWKTAGCGTCGLCWNTTKNVAFLEH